MSTRKQIALFDIDNTLYNGFSYFALLDKQADEGLINSSVPAQAKACMQKYKAGQQDYESTIVELLDIYAAALRGVAYDQVLSATKEFYKSSDKFFNYVDPTIKLLEPTRDISLVTGEPQFVARAVADLFGISTYYSSEYEVKRGVFTGRVTRYLASRHEKLAAIKHLMHGHGIKGSFAFGDSEGDIEMLRAVEHPICLNPTPELRAIAKQHGWHLPSLDQVQQLVARLQA